MRGRPKGRLTATETQQAATPSRRAVIDRTLAALPRGCNPTEGEMCGSGEWRLPTSPRRTDCEHALACLNVAAAGNWCALSCAECSLLGVPVDHGAELVELATRGESMPGIETMDTVGGGDAQAVKAALDHPRWVAHRQRIKEREQEQRDMAKRQNRYDALTGEARAIVDDAIAGKLSVTDAHRQLEACVGSEDAGSWKALYSHVARRKGSNGKATMPRPARTTPKKTRPKPAKPPTTAAVLEAEIAKRRREVEAALEVLAGGM